MVCLLKKKKEKKGREERFKIKKLYDDKLKCGSQGRLCGLVLRE